MSRGINYLVSSYLFKDVCTANTFGRHKWCLHQECRQIYLLSSSLLLAHTVKNLLAMQETHIPFLVGKMLWRKEWLPIPLFLPGKSHGQRNLVAHSCVAAELDMTEWLTHIYIQSEDDVSLQGLLILEKICFLDQGSSPEVKLTVFAEIIKVSLH